MKLGTQNMLITRMRDTITSKKSKGLRLIQLMKNHAYQRSCPIKQEISTINEDKNIYDLNISTNN